LNTLRNQAQKNEHLSIENEHLQQQEQRHEEQEQGESVQWGRDKVLELSSQGIVKDTYLQYCKLVLVQ
jgi:hypothetical protein